MSKGTRNVLIGTCLAVLAGGSALAQPQDPSTTDPTAGDPTANPAPPAAVTASEEPASRYPRSVIDRPLTFPEGLAMVGADVASSTSHFVDPAGIRLLAGYGITDDFEVNFAHYAFSTDDAGKGSIDGGLGYKLLRGAAGGKLEVIARAQTGYSLLTKQMNPLLLGVQAQYNATPKIAVYTPGGQFSIALDGPAGAGKPITFNIPIGIAYQAHKIAWIQLETSIGSLKIKDSENALIFRDVTPLNLTGIFNVMPQLDVIGSIFSLNITPPDGVELKDTLGVLVGARYYIGKL